MNLMLFEPGEIGQTIPKGDERNTHLRKVLGKGPGDSFDAGILGGNRGRGRIESLAPDGSISVSLDCHTPPPPKAPLVLAVGFPRPIQLRRLLRELCSMGIAGLDLISTELGEKSYRDTKLLVDGGAQAALKEGLIQARDTIPPALACWPSLAAWLEGRTGGEEGKLSSASILAFDNAPGALSVQEALEGTGGEKLALLIGSERGWSPAERKLLDSRAIVRAQMGERALRTECASIAAASLALAFLGFFG